MSFVKHESCPRCGSRDNLARYKDGSAWCFGCSYHERGSMSPYVLKERYEQDQDNDDEFGRAVGLPADATRLGGDSGPAQHWLRQYVITQEEANNVGWLYSPSYEQLIFPFYDSAGTLCCTQARNFNPQRASKAKYYNKGEKSRSYTVYGKYHEDDIRTQSSNIAGRGGSLLVLCEDAVSSLKVARCTPSMPLLGTHIAKDKLMALRASYDSLIVWLDSDKFKEAVYIADTAKWLGFKARAVFTELDPKELSDETIRKIVLDKD
jgi:hypothetical protein